MLALQDSHSRRSPKNSFQPPAMRSKSNAYNPPARRDFDPPQRPQQIQDRFFDNDIFTDPFKQVGKMMQNMHTMANQMFKEMERSSHGMMQNIDQMFNHDFFQNPGPGGRYIKNVYKQSSYNGQGGQPVVEKYQSQSYGAFDEQGRRIGERKQYYNHSGNGLEKQSHERMLGNKGRKAIQERMNGQCINSDLYKNISASQAQAFDQEWMQMARGLGFNDRALPSPSGLLYGQGQIRDYDNDRRGAYNQDYMKQPHMPVRRRDIQPTVPVQRALPAQRQRARQPMRRTVESAVPGAQLGNSKIQMSRQRVYSVGNMTDINSTPRRLDNVGFRLRTPQRRGTEISPPFHYNMPIIDVLTFDTDRETYLFLQKPPMQPMVYTPRQLQRQSLNLVRQSIVSFDSAQEKPWSERDSSVVNQQLWPSSSDNEEFQTFQDFSFRGSEGIVSSAFSESSVQSQQSEISVEFSNEQQFRDKEDRENAGTPVFKESNRKQLRKSARIAQMTPEDRKLAIIKAKQYPPNMFQAVKRRSTGESDLSIPIRQRSNRPKKMVRK